MMARRTGCLALLLALVAGPVPAFSAQPTLAGVQEVVAETERAFAQTMADRDLEAFKAFLSEEAIFFAGNDAMRGKAAVATGWQAFFEGDKAPFSWQPELIEVLDSGSLALSSGPLFDPQGKIVARFTSIWRLEADGQWRIIFDKGNRECPPPAPVADEHD